MKERRPRVEDQTSTPETTRPRWIYVLLLVPFIALLWVPFYASASPTFAGFPYFYWYQLVWVILGAILTAIVYLATD
jgi:hypothetical protein